MDLSLNEQQLMLKQGAEDFRARMATKEAILEVEQSSAGYSDEMWKTAAEIGWLSMVTPEGYGGFGGSLTDAAVVFEVLGHGPVPGPLFSSGVLSPLLIDAAGSDAQKEQYLPALASGQNVCSFAMTEPDWGWGWDAVQTTATPDGGGYTIDGTKLFVFDAYTADYLIVIARNGSEIVPVIVDTKADGVSIRRMKGFLTSECVVRLEGVKIDASAVLSGNLDAMHNAMLRATPILCAQLVGGAQEAYQMSVEYSRARKQFGQPIGRFQHVQNHIVQLVNNLDAARWTTYEALWKLDEGKDSADISVHLAKICSSEGYIEATNYAHEVHAGIGVAREYGLTLYTRTSRSLYHAMGDPRWHRKQLGNLLPRLASEVDAA